MTIEEVESGGAPCRGPVRSVLLSGWLWCWLLISLFQAGAAESLPPMPARHFTDHAGVVPAETVNRLNRALEAFESTNSSQVVVAVFSKMPSGAALEDFTFRIFQAWKVGQKGLDNGAALFVFIEDRRLRIEVGYGLEGALPDALCKRIIDEQITPHFKRGDYGAGLSAGVNALLQAARGEYKSTRRVQSKDPVSRFLERFLFNRFFPWNVFLVFLLLWFLGLFIKPKKRRGTVYRRSGRTVWTDRGRVGGRVGGGFSSGGGGFSGGGGRSGGGGASGRW